MATRRRPALERVLETADELFYTCGLHATGVDRIAAAANVSKATLYTYFQTKDDLVAEYLRRRSRQWQEHVAAELERRGGTPEDRMLAIFDLLEEWIRSPGYRGCPFINSAAETGPDSAAHQVNQEHRAWLHELFHELLEGRNHREATAHQLELLYNGAMSNAQVQPEVAWIAAAKRAVRAILTTA
ncbi:MAG TPA: TetR/AcrR family transcriptional regulator [Mycobacteriales bacterium]|nr:TetR/AcrR family transcriptional regulator [Mycobacteriales bacterium]